MGGDLPTTIAKATSAASMADDYWRLAHNDITGRLRLSERLASIGLAAGLLGELIEKGDIEIYEAHGRFLVLTQPARFDGHGPGEALDRRVLREIAAEPRPLEVRLWLLYLARDAYTWVCVSLGGQAGTCAGPPHACAISSPGHLRPDRHEQGRRADRCVVATASPTCCPSLRLPVPVRPGDRDRTGPRDPGCGAAPCRDSCPGRA